MSFQVQALRTDLPFGSIVTELDPADIADPAVRRALHDLWIERGLLIFRDMPGGPDTQVALSGIYGAPEAHPMRNPDNRGDRPELADITFHPDEGDIVRVDGVLKGAYLPWHFDRVSLPTITRGGILRAITRPRDGGETGFLDGMAIHDALPVDLQARIEGLYVTYHFDPNMDHQRYAKRPGLMHERVSARAQAAFERMKLPPVAHPLVFTQPGTERKVLNFSPWFATGIEEMAQEEADDILGRITPHFLDDSTAYFHRWDRDDMVLWDNWRMLHCAAGAPIDQPRHVQRTTIIGDYALGRRALEAVG